MLNFLLDQNGYKYAFAPRHPGANQAGKIYEHKLVMMAHIGRNLLPNEVVHHIDGVKTNNDIKNLLLLTREEHTKLHAVLSGKKISPERKICANCGRYFVVKWRKQQFCCQKCAKAKSRKLNIGKEELEKLVWEFPTTQLAKMLSVSDVAIARRCKKEGIMKPPPGYWRQLETIYSEALSKFH